MRCTESESAEYLTVCGRIAGIGVGIRKVGVSPTFAASIPSPPSSTSPTPTAWGFASLLCIVLLGNALVAVVVRVVSISTVRAFGGVRIEVALGFSRRENPICAGDVCLHRVWIHAERLTETVDVQTTCFFTYASFELRNRNAIDEGELGLDPIAKRVLRK